MKCQTSDRVNKAAMLIILSSLLVSLASCKTTHVISTTDTQLSRQEKNESATTSDSLIYRDTTYVYIYNAGDTIYKTVDKCIYRDRVVVKTDTLTVTLTDTVMKHVTETSVNEGKPPWRIIIIQFVFISAIIITTVTIIKAKTKV